MRDCFELLREAGLGRVPQVRVAGGGARSALWRRIVASVLGVELVTVTSSEGAAYGAALLAGVGTDVWPSVEAACEATIRIRERDDPEAGWQASYEALYPRYRELYPALSPTFGRLGA
jgi:xylulokinase